MPHQPKYRRHSIRNIAFVEYQKTRTYFGGKYGSEESIAEYRDFLQSLGFLVRDPGDNSDCEVTIPVLVDRFHEWAKATFPLGRKSRAANLATFCRRLLEFTGVDLAVKFTPRRLKEFQEWMVARGASRRYVNDATSAVRQVFKWGVSEELVPVAAYQALMTVSWVRRGRTAARETQPRGPVTWQHVKATLAKLRKPVRDMVEIQWLTGVRSQSLCAATVGQFDCKKKPWAWKPKHKTEHLGHDLTIFVGPKAQKLIGPYLAGKESDAFLFEPRSKVGKRSRRYRKHYDSDSYRQAVQRGAKAAGVPAWTPHQLRHALGTLVREKFGLEGAQAALGHARIDVTQLYAQKQMALAKKIAEAMG